MRKLPFILLIPFVLFLNEAFADRPINKGPIGKGEGASVDLHYVTTQAEPSLVNETILSANGLNIVTTATYAAMRALLDLEAGIDFYSLSAANTLFDARCLESVFGSSIGVGLALVGTTLETHAYLQDIAGLTLDSGDIFYTDGSDILDLAIGTNGYFLKVSGGIAGWTNTGNFNALQIPNAESADAVLTTIGQIQLRGDEDRVSYHAGAGGEIAGEVTKSLLDTFSDRFDPGTWYCSDTERFLFTVEADVYPNGIIIDEWNCSCNVDPDVEINADLRYADAWIGLANAADIDEIDTTNGVSSEDTDANINSGAAVAAGKVIYIGFDADPEGTCVQMIFEMTYHAEED